MDEEYLKIFRDEGKRLLSSDRQALIKAAGAGDLTKISQIVAAGGTVRVTDWNGYTPLHQAAYQGQEAAIKALLAAKADVHARDKGGSTPMHHAAHQREEGPILALLKAKANVHVRNRRGDTPLANATELGKTSAAKVLRRLGATL